MSMIRKIARGIAKYNLHQQDIKWGGMYATQKDVLIAEGRGRKKHYRIGEKRVSYFSKAWRSWL